MKMSNMGLVRSRRDRWILGVCGGIAHTWGVDVRAVRLAAVLLAILIPGFSALPVFLVYIILGIFLPESNEF